MCLCRCVQVPLQLAILKKNIHCRSALFTHSRPLWCVFPEQQDSRVCLCAKCVFTSLVPIPSVPSKHGWLFFSKADCFVLNFLSTLTLSCGLRSVVSFKMARVLFSPDTPVKNLRPWNTEIANLKYWKAKWGLQTSLGSNSFWAKCLQV